MTDAMPKTIPNMPWKAGRRCRGIMGIMINRQPEKMPAEPRPAMARPRINTVELGAAPQIAEPISKTMMLKRKDLYCAQRNCTLAQGYTVTYHFIS
jgi:hypothetical protein